MRSEAAAMELEDRYKPRETQIGSNPLNVWVRFLARSSRARTIPELIDVVTRFLPQVLPISYVSFFYREGDSDYLLNAESRPFLASDGITHLSYDQPSLSHEWALPLQKLVPERERRDGYRKLDRRLRCMPVSVRGRIGGLLCFQLKSKRPGKMTRGLLKLSSTQLGLSLERIKGEKTAQHKYFCQINEMAEMGEHLVHSERESCTAEMALGVADCIRNPITIIGGLLNRISKGIQLTSTSRRDWEFLFQEVEKLERLVRDFEKFAHKRTFRFETENINQMIRQTVKTVKLDFRRMKEVSLQVDLPETPCYVEMDRRVVGAALTHLLLNAAEATGPNGAISLILKEQDSRICIEISDNGKGIPEAYLERIFDPFFTTKPDGTGLGLTYANQIITEHNGEMSVRSELGIGTTFSVLLPRARKQPAEPGGPLKDRQVGHRAGSGP